MFKISTLLLVIPMALSLGAKDSHAQNADNSTVKPTRNSFLEMTWRPGYEGMLKDYYSPYGLSLSYNSLVEGKRFVPGGGLNFRPYRIAAKELDLSGIGQWEVFGRLALRLNNQPRAKYYFSLAYQLNIVAPVIEDKRLSNASTIGIIPKVTDGFSHQIGADVSIRLSHIIWLNTGLQFARRKVSEIGSYDIQPDTYYFNIKGGLIFRLDKP